MKRQAGRRSTLASLEGIGLGAATLAALLGLGAGTARAEDAFVCGAKEVHGVAPEDAQTAVALVCAEIRRESGGRGEYEVSLGTLGRLVILGIERLEPRRSETVRLDAIEEVEVAAPRLARALASGETFPATQRVDNLLDGETRPAPVKKGSVKFAAGIADVETPGFGARGTGFSLGLQYATPRFSLPVDLRFAIDDDGYDYAAPQVSLFAVSVGGRTFLSRRNVSPFAGAGLGMLWLHASEGAYPGYEGATGPYFDADTLGVAPYAGGRRGPAPSPRAPRPVRPRGPAARLAREPGDPLPGLGPAHERARPGDGHPGRVALRGSPVRRRDRGLLTRPARSACPGRRPARS
jgi:hypothetical protein